MKPTTELEMAGLRRRLGSMFYEALLVLGVLAVTFMLPHMLLGMLADVSLPGPLLVLHIFLVLGAYFLWYWQKNGQTLAMQTWRLKLVDMAGNPPTRQQLLLRYVLLWPSLLFYAAGIFWSLLDRERLFLHDRLAGTRLIVVQPTTAATLPPAETSDSA